MEVVVQVVHWGLGAPKWDPICQSTLCCSDWQMGNTT